jgi:acetylornithine deacetylase
MTQLPPDAAVRTDALAADHVTETLALLVRTPSVNPHLDAASAGEAAIAAMIRDWCLERGIAAWLEEAAPGRPNVVARVGSGDSPVLVLCAHTDTVATEGMAGDPFGAGIEGGRLHGRGAYDMKGGAAAILCALADLARDPPRGTVLGAFVVDEEYASAGAFDFVQRHRADACLLTEFSDEQLVLAHKGFIWLEVTTHGVASHGSRWDLGRSAIADMGRVLAALDRFDREVLRQRTHPLVGPASLHPAVIRGGDGWSTYAASCTLRVERRTLPGEAADAVIAELGDVIRGAGVDAAVEVALVRAPLECPADAPLARHVRAAAADVLGREPAEGGVGYWMDAAVFAEAGMPALNYGPAGAGAPAAVEWVDIESVARCARVLAATARRFCAR